MKARKTAAAVTAALTVSCIMAAAFVMNMGEKGELVYINGVKAEYFAGLFCGVGIVLAGVTAGLLINVRRTAARLLRTVGVAAVIICGVLFFTNTLAEKHRMLLLEDMCASGSHRVVSAKDGDDFVYYQQNGKYTYAEFYRSKTPVTPLDIYFADNGIYITVGEKYDDPENIQVISEFFEYTEYNR